ncbi:MAG: hypothetical protein IPK12_17335 [Gemmatimonadetes bacterium]|nr:hypothetical protein [Gemmatimonadota bacterium]
MRPSRRGSSTVQAPTAPSASAGASAGRSRLWRAKLSVTAVEEMSPPSIPATAVPRRTPTTRRATHPAKLSPETRSTTTHSSRGRMPPSGP